MQTNNRLFDDLARLANGAVTTVSALREEIEALVRQQVERLAGDLDLVSRDEVEAIRAVAVNARAEQEALAARVADLEARIAALTGQPASKEGGETADT